MFVGKKIENNTLRLLPAVKVVSKKPIIQTEAEIQCPPSTQQTQIKGKLKEPSLAIKIKEINTAKMQKKPAQQNKIEKQMAKSNKTKAKPLNSIHIQNKINIKNANKRGQDKGANKNTSKTQKNLLDVTSKAKDNNQKPKQMKKAFKNNHKNVECTEVKRQSQKINEPFIQQNEQTQIDEEDEVQLARQYLPNPLPNNSIFGQMLQFQDSLLEPQYFPPQQHKNEFLPQEYSFNTPSDDIDLNMQLFELNAEELLALDYLAI